MPCRRSDAQRRAQITRKCPRAALIAPKSTLSSDPSNETVTPMLAEKDLSSLSRIAPFWLSLLTVPVAIGSAALGGPWVLALPVFAWGLFSVLDALTGLETQNADPGIGEGALRWYARLTWIWFPVQAALIYGLLAWAVQAPHLGPAEKAGLFFGLGVVSGTIGITYAHELMHRSGRGERWLGDLLMAMALYGHFRSEHLLVHHRHVATPRDAVTARYNEGFHRHFPRVLRQSLVSAFRAEAGRLARRGRPWWHRSNPFWRYGLLQAGFLALAGWIGGMEGLALFALQAATAIWQLELVNYVEHYGLTRKHLGGGRYEPVRPRHSWNASQKATNWLLINLQRHFDHHTRPDRRFPLLQSHGPEEAPQLPFGYPVMTTLAMIPPLWRRVMNPRVRAWRRQFYPEIADWTPYRTGALPHPR